MRISNAYNIFLRLIFLCLLCFIFYPFTIFAQKTNFDSIEINNEELNQKIERIAEQTDAELDYNSLVENINYYHKHPLNLNNASAEELVKLMVLTDIQINNFFEHINKNGKLLSIYELQSIEGFDLETIYKLLPYVYISNNENKRHFSFSEVLKNSNNELILRYQQVLEKKKGFSQITDSAFAANPNSRYLGSPEALFVKYRFTYYNNISIGFIASKDAGEQFFKGSDKNGFDFYSAHLFYRNSGLIKALAIGDFQAQFGQGQTLWTGLGFGKSSEGTEIKKCAEGIRPYTSAMDNLFMRGVATTIGLKNFELSMLFSSKKIDANITSIDSTNNETLYFSSLQQTGLHATPAEIYDKDAISETAVGGHFCFKSPKINIGATAFKSEYSATLQHQIQLYNQFEFNGKENTNLGFDYSYIFRNINLFGEISESENKAKAILSGLLISPDPKVTLSFLYRNYDKKYQALYSSAFAESSTPANENGIYCGIFLKPFFGFSINAYLDNISFPWLKYRIDAPSSAIDYFLQLNWSTTKNTEMYFRYRQTNKSLNDPELSDVVNVPSNTLKQDCRYNISYKISNSITLKNCIEFTNYKTMNIAPQNGYLIYQDLNFKKTKSKFSFSLRYALFDCDTYNSRIYSYENDVLYAYSISALYNKGTRFYITMHYRINRNFDFWLKFDQTYYNNINVISSGLTEIDGNKKSEIKAQIRVKF